MNPRIQPIADWHAGRLSSNELAAALGDELLDVLDDYTPSQLRRPHSRYGPLWFVDDWWTSVCGTLDLTGFSTDDYTALLIHLDGRLPRWGLRPPPSPSEDVEEITAGRRCVAQLYLDVDGVFSPICMGNHHAADLVWMRGPAVAIGEAPDTGWTWKMITGWGPTPLPVELAHHIADLDATSVEVVWVTGWYESANGFLDDVGVDAHFRSIPWREDVRGIGKWEFIINELQRDPVPFVWVDDDEVGPSTWRWAANCDVPNLLVRTNRYHGVTPATWSTIIAWLQEHGGVDLSRLAGATLTLPTEDPEISE